MIDGEATASFFLCAFLAREKILKIFKKFQKNY